LAIQKYPYLKSELLKHEIDVARVEAGNLVTLWGHVHRITD
jgi:hypothetical protein